MLNKDNTGLIIVDIQGKLAHSVSNSDSLIENCQKLIKGVKALGLPIVWLEQNPEKLGETAEELRVLLDDGQPITKFSFDACEESLFTQAVQKSGKSSWLVCGIEAHICVFQTAISLKNQGNEVHFVSDCTSSREMANKELAVRRLIQGGVTITGLEMCLYELVKDCRTPEFREVLNLIR